MPPSYEIAIGSDPSPGDWPPLRVASVCARARPIQDGEVRDTRIDVAAQRSLMRMSRRSPLESAHANEILAAIKRGAVGGIYREDQRAPALRARASGSSFWHIIPRGRGGASQPDPGGREPPFIVLRNAAADDPDRLDRAMREVWQEIRISVGACGGGTAEPHCGVPAQARLTDVTFAEAPAMTPTLCFFQSRRPDSAFFRNQANRWARRIRSPMQQDGACPSSIGPAAYATGADIIRILDAAFMCLGATALTHIHLFGHMYEHGIVGDRDMTGLYFRDPVPGRNPLNRAAGGRTVADFPLSSLSPDAVIVLHGCSTAMGTNNFAKALFDQINVPGTARRVFGHPISVCCGQDTTWREYSPSSPNGMGRARIAPVYDGTGSFC